MFKRILVLIITALLLAACNGTGDKNTDEQAAQQFFPNLTGYTTYETETIQQAVTTTLGSATALTGNLIFAGMVERMDTLLSCYRDVGAADAIIYVEQLTNLTTVRPPNAGVLLIVNNDRAQSNFLSCISDTPLSGVLGAQSAEVQPCSNTGTFQSGGDRFTYVYAASNTPLCDLFQQNFNNLGG